MSVCVCVGREGGGGERDGERDVNRGFESGSGLGTNTSSDGV